MTLFFAFAILLISVLRTASVKYEVSGTLRDQKNQDESRGLKIDYFLAYPGRVLPDSPLWSLKALRDRFWLMITTDSKRRIELKILFADKRLGASEILFKKKKASEALTTLTKAEKYLEEASLEEEIIRRKGYDTTDLLYALANSSLKHYQVIRELLEFVPEDTVPLILSIQEYPKKSYERARNGILEKMKTPPDNPFDW